MKKFTVFFLSMVICLLGAIPVLAQKWPEGPFTTEDFVYTTLAEYEEVTGKTITSFYEPTMLRSKVASGELPPVEERLPKEPMVIQPVEEVGRYGGQLTTIVWHGAYYPVMVTMTRQNPGFTKVMPYIARELKFSEDYKTVTLYLREGLKYSDGHLFTVDDILFTWEDVILNEELTPAIPNRWMPGGELAKFEKIDDYTLNIHFAVPSPSKYFEFARTWMAGGQAMFFDPKHYLKKWHIKYNPEADELAKEEGYDRWEQAFVFHREGVRPNTVEIGCPGLGPWVKTKATTTYTVLERNPYYFAVDTEGNQLPYIDRLIMNVKPDEETFNMQILVGEYDYVGIKALTDIPLYIKNQEKGGYRILMAMNPPTANPGISFNLNYKDPVLQKIFQDIRWRRAMSLAINREEINEVFYLDKATPMAVAPLPFTSFYKKEWGEAHPYIRYDPQEASELLDEMGLDSRDTEGWRLRPDGKKLVLEIQYSSDYPKRGKILEVVKEYWEAVGVTANMKPIERSYYVMQAQAGELMVGSWDVSGASEGMLFTQPLRLFRFGGAELGVAVKWHQWIQTGGEQGEEPPEEVKGYYKWIDEWVTTLPGTPHYIELAQKIFDWYAENLWTIGTVGMPTTAFVINRNLRNVGPLEGMPQGFDTVNNTPYLPVQWFYQE